jgi:hypothetical protein
MSTLVVAEVNTLLYALAIPDNDISQIIFIEVKPELKRLGIRPFSESEELARVICDLLEIKYQFFSTSDSGFVEQLISSDSIVDLSVISYFQISKKKRKNCKLVSGAVEQTFINSPPFLYGLNSHLKLRIDLLRKIFIPLKIFSFYSLGKKEVILPLIRTKSIDFKLFKSVTHSLLPDLLAKLDLDHVNFSASLGDSKAKKTLIVLPRPREHGGSFHLNTKIINEAIEHAIANGFDQVVIKNHPMDDTNYSNLGFDAYAFSIIYLCNTKQRMFPLELLINFYDQVSFYGVFSMATYTLHEFLCEIPHVYLPNNNSLFEYSTGNILRNMKHVPHFLPWEVS